MIGEHLIITPIVLPSMTGAVLLLIERRAGRFVGWLSMLSTLAQLAVALALLARAGNGDVQAYLLGDWQAPWGIALALDRLSALMLVLASLVALASLLYASGADTGRGAHFHTLFQFQLMGLNGAFLTADLFNLFVFFEVLLIASYGLLLHGGGDARLRASIHYVVFNLAGSALFLIAVSLLYGLLGTLNMADLALRVAQVPTAHAAPVRSAALLLLVVFGVKAALLPLYFWVPQTYASATASVASLFAIMTKVGVYTIARVYTLVFGAAGGAASEVAWPWLALLAMGTLALGTIGMLASGKLRGLVAYSVVASAGTLLLAFGLGLQATASAGLFYLVHSTLTAAGLFLIVDRVSIARGEAGDRLRRAPFIERRTQLGVAFFFFAVASAGLPPLSGFVGKALLLRSALASPLAWIAWFVLLSTGLGMLIALARAGSVLFWWPPVQGSRASEPLDDSRPGTAQNGAILQPGAAYKAGILRPGAAQAGAILLLAAALGVATLWAGTLHAYTEAAAQQLFQRTGYLDAVLGARTTRSSVHASGNTR